MNAIFKEQRVGLFVDVQNMYYSAKQLYNMKVNFANILKKAVGRRKLIRAFAYVIKADIKEETNFFDALENQGYDVKMKDLQVFYGGAKKGDWDIGIAMDIMRMTSKLDVIVLVSGDGDFQELVEYAQALGCRVEVMAFGKTASSKLKNTADEYIDMENDKKTYLIQEYGSGSRSSAKPLTASMRVVDSNSSSNAISSATTSPSLSASSSQSSGPTSGQPDSPPSSRTTVRSSNRSMGRNNRSYSGSSSGRSPPSRRGPPNRSSYQRNSGRGDYRTSRPSSYDSVSSLQKINMEQFSDEPKAAAQPKPETNAKAPISSEQKQANNTKPPVKAEAKSEPVKPKSGLLSKLKKKLTEKKT